MDVWPGTTIRLGPSQSGSHGIFSKRLSSPESVLSSRRELGIQVKPEESGTKLQSNCEFFEVLNHCVTRVQRWLLQ